MGKPRSKESEFIERQLAAAAAKKAMLERFRGVAGNPDTAPRQQTQAAEAAERERAAQAKQKAADDARDAARKAKGKADAKAGAKTASKAGAKKGRR